MNDKKGDREVDVLEALAKQGQAIEEAFLEAQEQARIERREREEEHMAYELACLREKLGITEDEDALWQALAPRAGDGRFVLTVYGVQGGIYKDFSGWTANLMRGQIDRGSLALFIARAKALREEIKDKIITNLSENDSLDAYKNECKRAVVVAGLWDDPDVQAARMGFLLRHRITDITTNPDFWWYQVWLDEALALPMAQERAEMLDFREKARKWAGLQHCLTMSEGDVVDEEQLTQWRTEAGQFGKDAPQHWFIILNQLTQLLEVDRADAAWHKQRVELEEAAFFPFRYYEVGYGYLFENDEDGLGVETDVIPTLHMPDKEGWIVDERINARTKVIAMTTITEKKVEKLTDLPGWRCCWRGEGQRRYQAPPEGAERL